MRKRLSEYFKRLSIWIYPEPIKSKQWVVVTIYMKIIMVDKQQTAHAEATTNILEAMDATEAKVRAFKMDKGMYNGFERFEPSITLLDL